MNIKGNRIKVQKSAEELFQFLQQPQNFESLMPEDVSTFEADDQTFTFALKGMPKVYLKLAESTPNSQVNYASAKADLDFTLTIHIFETETTEMEIDFEGKFNPFIKMMVEKPLSHFIATLTTNAEKL